MKIIYTCTKCDGQAPKWSGRCLECGAWGTLEATSAKSAAKEKIINDTQPGKTVSFKDVALSKQLYQTSGLKEVDRVLGQGIVRGALMLLGGDPGIGKSTLALQIASSFSGKVLYVSAEESAEQVKLRAARLKVQNADLKFLAEESLEVIVSTLIKENPALVVIDSIQTINSEEISGENGGVNQIRSATLKFLEVAKTHNIPIILIGHVTKEGALAGPKSLEHLVDVVLYLEGDQYQQYRILRSAKNRFGSTQEIGVFDMEEAGLKEITNPTQIFLAQRSTYPGSCLTALLKGTRVFLVEIQALVSKTVFGYPVRKAAGFDQNRLQMLLAVLTKRLKLPLGNYDIYLNVIGGMKVNEPAADLAACLAIISAYLDKALPEDLVALGEVGLGGELRPTARLETRAKQLKNLGYQKIICAPEYKSLSEIIKRLAI